MMVALAALLSRAFPRRAPQTRINLWRADRLDGASGDYDADPAPARVLPGRASFSPSAWAGRPHHPCCSPGPRCRLTQYRIALFALTSVSGAIGAPIAGRLADRGFSRPATGAAISAGHHSFVHDPLCSLQARRWRWRFSSPRRSRSISAFRPIWSSASTPSSRFHPRRESASMLASTSGLTVRRRAVR